MLRIFYTVTPSISKGNLMEKMSKASMLVEEEKHKIALHVKRMERRFSPDKNNALLCTWFWRAVCTCVNNVVKEAAGQQYLDYCIQCLH